MPFYQGYLATIGEEKIGAACYLCGRSTFEISVAGALRPDVRRTVTHCSRCGVISDRPSHDPFIEILGDDNCHPGEIVSEKVVFCNVGTDARAFAACITFEEDLPWFHVTTVPAHAEGCADPGEEAACEFNVRIDPASRPGTYYMIATVVSHLAINISVKPFVVR
jgi:hypothetical protein